MNLARTKRGTMIHERDCRYAKKGFPWHWAEGRFEFVVWEAVLQMGYKTCNHCKPFGE